MLEDLIKQSVSEFKHFSYNEKTGLITFFNEEIFGGLKLGPRQYESLRNVIEFRLVEFIAQNMASKISDITEQARILATTKLEIFANVTQYLEKGGIGDAIELLYQYLLNKPTKKLAVRIGEDEKVIAVGKEKINPGDEYRITIQMVDPSLYGGNHASLIAAIQRAMGGVIYIPQKEDNSHENI